MFVIIKPALSDQTDHIFGYLHPTYGGALKNGSVLEVLNSAFLVLVGVMLSFQGTGFSHKTTVKAVGTLKPRCSSLRA